MVKQSEIRGFLEEANRKGYAAGEGQEVPERRIIKEEDGSTTIIIGIGDFKLHDNYFGGEPYGGREVISYKGKPVWMMVYYGSVDEETATSKIYPFLMKALGNAAEELPVRGPKEIEDGNFRYENSWEGNFNDFKGSERILVDGKEVYKASYIGGLVDKREG